MEKRVAYYAHHHGTGHVQHAIDFAETTDYELLLLTSRQVEGKLRHANYVQLSEDIVEGHTEPRNSLFHYSPSNPKIQKRFHMIAAELGKFKPDVVIVDVSVEVATFIKLLGYPVIYRLMHGDRTDKPHTAVYDNSDKLIAYYPAAIEQQGRNSQLVSNVFYTGIREVLVKRSSIQNKNSICVLTSTGGEGVNFKDLEYACQQMPKWHWTVLGTITGYDAAVDNLPTNCQLQGYVNDPDAYLATSSVIITASGHNAVARSVSHDKPLILFAEDRPFNEQHCFAKSIAQNTDVDYIESWKEVDWTKRLHQALTQDIASTRSTLLVADKQYGHMLKTSIESINSSMD